MGYQLFKKRHPDLYTENIFSSLFTEHKTKNKILLQKKSTIVLIGSLSSTKKGKCHHHHKNYSLKMNEFVFLQVEGQGGNNNKDGIFQTETQERK